MSHQKPEDQSRQMPAWLMGLIIAAVLFVIGFFVFNALGFGDDPVIERSVLAPLFAIEVARQRRVSG